MTLSWRPPSQDGGSKIRGYLLEYKKKDEEEWTQDNNLPHPDTNYTVLNLTELQEYVFRVIAVNDVGNSAPSRPSAPIKIEEQANKPRIDLSGIRDITVRAGEDFSIHVPYTGFPKPTSIWYHDDEEMSIEGDTRIHEKLTDDYCAMIVTNSKRTDSGPYKLRLQNPSGFDSVNVNVRVLDRPAPPENLRADEFNGDALTLFWNPPKDNGGGEITNYVVEKREGRGNWVKVSSYVTAPFLRIRNLTVNQDYEFRVMAENQYGTSDPCTSPTPIKARHPFGKTRLQRRPILLSSDRKTTRRRVPAISSITPSFSRSPGRPRSSPRPRVHRRLDHHQLDQASPRRRRLHPGLQRGEARRGREHLEQGQPRPHQGHHVPRDQPRRAPGVRVPRRRRQRRRPRPLERPQREHQVHQLP